MTQIGAMQDLGIGLQLSNGPLPTSMVTPKALHGQLQGLQLFWRSIGKGSPVRLDVLDAVIDSIWRVRMAHRTSCTSETGWASVNRDLNKSSGKAKQKP